MSNNQQYKTHENIAEQDMLAKIENTKHESNILCKMRKLYNLLLETNKFRSDAIDSAIESLCSDFDIEKAREEFENKIMFIYDQTIDTVLENDSPELIFNRFRWTKSNFTSEFLDFFYNSTDDGKIIQDLEKSMY